MRRIWFALAMLACSGGETELGETDMGDDPLGPLRGLVFIQDGFDVGWASYHFDAIDDCYIGYHNATWTTDAGQLFPAEKPFLSVAFDAESRLLAIQRQRLTSRIDLILTRGLEGSANGGTDWRLWSTVVGDEPRDRVFYEYGGYYLWPSDHAGVVATVRIH